ncbi:MAG: universal stress protein [Chloroflexi bacterium]|nr:universal stress protein [Chloroflexota bacterium]
MIKRIIVPLDGSSLAEKALPYAEMLAQKFEAELILVRALVILPEMVIGGPRAMVFHEHRIEERKEAEAYLNDLLGQLGHHHLPARYVIIDSQPAAEAIIDLAGQEAADLIVMSTHGRSEVGRWIHGSVATKVLQHAPCPIFLVRASKGD